MRIRKLSQLIVLVGIMVSMAAIWVGSAPLAGVNGPVLGGYAMFADTSTDGVTFIATTVAACTSCSSVVSRSCSAYDIRNSGLGNYCWGGDAAVAVSGGSGTIGDAGLSVCTGNHWWCSDLHDATCNF